MYRILIVEDDKMLNSGIAAALKGEDMEFLSCYNLRTARDMPYLFVKSSVALNLS